MNFLKKQSCDFLRSLKGGLHNTDGEISNWRNELESQKVGGLSALQTIYEGEFYLTRKHGFGHMRWTDGSHFTGAFKKDSVLLGEMTWADGAVYKGEWLNDLRHGSGTMIWKDGKKFSGQWIKGKAYGIDDEERKFPNFYL